MQAKRFDGSYQSGCAIIEWAASYGTKIEFWLDYGLRISNKRYVLPTDWVVRDRKGMFVACDERIYDAQIFHS